MTTMWRRRLPEALTAIGTMVFVTSSSAQSTTPVTAAYEIALKDGLCAAADYSSAVLEIAKEKEKLSVAAPADLYAYLLSLAMCNRGSQHAALIRRTPSEKWQTALEAWDLLTDEGIVKNPNNCVALLFRADAQSRKGNISIARELTSNIRMRPECSFQVAACALLIEAHLLLEQAPADEDGRARDLLEKASETATQSSAPLIDLGFYYLASDHFVRLKAKTYFLQALHGQRDPNNPLAKLGLAKAEGNMEALNEAKKEVGLRTLIIWIIKVGGVASASKETIDEKEPFKKSLSLIYPEVENESHR